jgi:hypothetical protein
MPRTASPKVVATTQERLTGFDSHGQRYVRLALPRDPFLSYESPLNLWDVEVRSDGSFTATPVRELVKVEPRVAKGARTATK